MNKATVIIGASPQTERYSYKACRCLSESGHTVFPLGIRPGKINDLEIITDKPKLKDIHTVSVYINPQLQIQWEDYIISLEPKRVIFNPGTENEDLKIKLQQHGIETLEACTLVMLSLGNY